MIDVGICMQSAQRICREVPHHIFMHFLLQVDADSPIGSDNFIRANACVGRHITVRIADLHITRNISNRYLCPGNGGGNELLSECDLCGPCGVCANETAQTQTQTIKAAIPFLIHRLRC